MGCGENSAGDVQLIVTRSPHDSVTDSERYFTLSFTDMFGGTFTTRPILDLKATFAELTTKIKRVDLLGDANSANAATTYEDFQPCSSKGDCDAATGTCTCNAGHYGEACEKQSTYY